MRKFYLLLSALFICTVLYSQHRESTNIIEKLLWDDNMLNIMIDTRVDARAGIDNGHLEDLGFQGQTIKIWFVGEIVPGIRYRLRQRLNKPQTPLREGYSSATDQAWLAFDIGKHWVITAGKQSVQFGTYEYDYSGADVYMGSMVYNDLDSYKTGVDVAYKFCGQTLHLQIINSDANQFASAAYAKKALAATTLWEGHLFKDVLNTRWGYGIFQHSKDRFYNWITVGTQLNIGDFTTELDYYVGDRNMDYGYMVGSDIGSRFVRDQSASVNFKYDFGKWRPFIKGVWNQRFDHNYNSVAYDGLGIQAVLEYYPFTHPWVKDLRFHVMYGYSTTNFHGHFADLVSQDVNTVLFGFRWLFKVK